MNAFDLLNLPRNAVIAHRGASAHAPENTLPAFELAISQGADAIELDVMLTKDEEVIVFHDNRLERVTNGSGAVRAHLWAEIAQLDAGSWFGSEYAGVGVPRLKTVLQQIAPNIVINIELKNETAPFNRLSACVAALLKQTQTIGRVFISSFNPLALTRFHRALPEVPIGLLGLGTVPWLAWLVHHDAVHPYFKTVTEPIIRRAQQRGKRVHAYTVNQPEDLRQLFRWGIDGVFTDDPQLADTIRAEVLHD